MEAGAPRSSTAVRPRTGGSCSGGRFAVSRRRPGSRHPNGSAVGSSTSKQAPPCHGTHRTSPPSARTMAREIGGPRPVPSPPREFDRRTKRSKIRSRSAVGTPGPVSMMRIVTRPSSCTTVLTSTVPLGKVAVGALSSRLPSAGCNWSGSASNGVGGPGRPATSRSRGTSRLRRRREAVSLWWPAFRRAFAHAAPAVVADGMRCGSNSCSVTTTHAA